MPEPLTDLNTGLTAAEAAARKAAGLDNRAPAAGKTVWRIAAEQIFTFFNLVFVLLAAALWAVGSVANMGFLLVVVCNTGIGLFQHLRAKRTLDKLKLVAVRPVRCLRDGVWQELPAAALVQGDIIELANGDPVCADAFVRAGVVWVNEALLTGEAHAVEKRPGAALRSGSFAAAGRCTAQLTRVGPASYASRMTAAARAHARPARGEMMASLDRLIRWIGVLLAPLGAVLFVKQYWLLHLPLRDATEATVAALIGMIPEGLYLLTSVALAVSVRRLGRRRVLTREMNCIETLARVDVLCVDKTGTITEPGMDAEDPLLLDPQAWPAAKTAELLRAIGSAGHPESETGLALAVRFAPGQSASLWPVQARVPFNSEYKWSAFAFRGRGCFVLGAPDRVAGPRAAEFASALAPLLAAGRRVLLLAACDDLPDPAAGLAPEKLRFIALLPFTARLRPQAREIVSWFTAQGVAVKVLSGDDPVTAGAAARLAGVPGAERCADAGVQPDAAADTVVFGRITPEGKQRLVRAWKAQGHTVAMVGDGVNDVLALREADCGIAMASGAQAAGQAAQMVLLDNDFAALPAIVAEGRRVINNIQRSATLFLVKNIFSFLLVIFTLPAPLAYPLEPLQLSLVSMTTIGIPAFVLALEPGRARVRGRFMRNVMSAALPGGVTDFLLLVGVQVTALLLDLERAEVSTVCTAVLLTVGLCVLWGLCRPLQPRHRLLLGAMAALGAVGIVALQPLLGLAALDVQGTLVLAAFMAAAPAALWAVYRLLPRRLKEPASVQNV